MLRLWGVKQGSPRGDGLESLRGGGLRPKVLSFRAGRALVRKQALNGRRQGVVLRRGLGLKGWRCPVL